jgi:hypothetical protein
MNIGESVLILGAGLLIAAQTYAEDPSPLSYDISASMLGFELLL